MEPQGSVIASVYLRLHRRQTGMRPLLLLAVFALLLAAWLPAPSAAAQSSGGALGGIGDAAVCTQSGGEWDFAMRTCTGRLTDSTDMGFNTSTEYACTSIGGTWDAAGRTCNVSAAVVEKMICSLLGYVWEDGACDYPLDLPQERAVSQATLDRLGALLDAQSGGSPPVADPGAGGGPPGGFETSSEALLCRQSGGEWDDATRTCRSAADDVADAFGTLLDQAAARAAAAYAAAACEGIPGATWDANAQECTLPQLTVPRPGGGVFGTGPGQSLPGARPTPVPTADEIDAGD